MSAPGPIVMPKLGLTMQEGLLSSWLVKPGSIVATGDVIFVVETDKIANEVEAHQGGTIGQILIPEGETVPIGTALATWAGGEVASNTKPGGLGHCADRTDDVDEPASARPAGERIVATPLAKRLAKNSGLDLRNVAGSGMRGRIMAADVKKAQEAGPVTAAPHATPAGVQANATAASNRRTVSHSRRIAARRLTLSKQTIPHFYVLADADVTSLGRLRVELNDMPDGPRISVNHFIVTALGRALAGMPELDAIWRDDGIEALESGDVGIAVETGTGVLAPVLRGVSRMTLDQVAIAAGQLVQRARDGKLKPDDMSGGAATISNVGMYGAAHLVPIINPGQSMILGVGSSRKIFRPDPDGNPVVRDEIGLVLSCDHRMVDGAAAAKFLNKIKQGLESPLALLRTPH